MWSIWEGERVRLVGMKMGLGGVSLGPRTRLESLIGRKRRADDIF